MPPKRIQKFRIGSKVHICKKMPKNMSHFESDFDAVVQHTYAQRYGGNNIKSYCVIMLDAFGKPIDSIAWYHESQLSFLDDNVETGRKIVEEFY